MSERKKKQDFTHSEAPETGVAARTEAYDLYFALARKMEPTVEKMIDPPGAEVGANIN